MNEPLTQRQREVIDFINIFRSKYQANPTRAEIADHFGWKSANAAEEHLQAMQRKGVVQLVTCSRGIFVNAPWDTLRVAA